MSRTTNRSDLPTMAWHLLLVFFLGLSLLTGLRIAADNARGGWRALLEPLMLQGDVMRWHMWAALALAGLIVAYAAFLWRAQLKARWVVSSAALKAPRGRWQAINRLLYWLGLVCLALAILTGVWLYFLPSLGWLSPITLVHEITSWSLLVYMVIHILAQFMLGGWRQLLKVFIPRFDLLQAGAVMGCAALVSGLAFWALDWQITPELHLKHVASAPLLDGETNEWQGIPEVEVVTAHGFRTPDTETRVRVRGVVHGDRAYFLFAWQDPTRSLKNRPLLKTENGWKQLKKKTENGNQVDYYEDKFAVILSHLNIPFAGSWQFGPEPISGLPKVENGRGYHAMLDGSLADVWYWKSARSIPMGQMDDTHFGAPIDPKNIEAGEPHPGGYDKDPKEGGGYTDNFTKENDILLPKRLPKDPKALMARLGTPKLDPNQSDDSHYTILMDDTVPYTPELDTYPVGTLLPSLLIKGPFKGDRGDISAAGRWQDGWWQLEVSRKLDTGHPKDVAIRDRSYLWFAAFDNNKTEHSWHVVPVRLRLD